LATSNAVTTSAVPAPPPQQPQLQQPAALQLQQPATLPPQPPPQAQPQPQTIAALPAASTPAAQPQPQPRADTARELSPNEIAGLVRRAQEMLANGDVKAARLLLLRAAEARDARAALALAKTYDPIALRQLSTVDPGPDLAQARSWYQKAREWGAPEAQRQLDALASYSR
jgi:TPR repeat protein